MSTPVPSTLGKKRAARRAVSRVASNCSLLRRWKLVLHPAFLPEGLHDPHAGEPFVESGEGVADAVPHGGVRPGWNWFCSAPPPRARAKGRPA